MEKIRILLGVLLLITALWLLSVLSGQLHPQHITRQHVVEEQIKKALWQPFDPDKITNLVRQGNIVFVDVTAEWCLTCKVNKFTTLNRADVVRMLSSPNITAMRADITAFDPTINSYLKKFERYGIPFNAVYGPKSPSGIALPVLISAEDVEKALKQAGWGK